MRGSGGDGSRTDSGRRVARISAAESSTTQRGTQTVVGRPLRSAPPPSTTPSPHAYVPGTGDDYFVRRSPARACRASRRPTNAAFWLPSAVAAGSQAQVLYVADMGNHRVRAIDIATAEVTTLVGGDARAPAASARRACSTSRRRRGRRVHGGFVADSQNRVIRGELATGRARTLAARPASPASSTAAAAPPLRSRAACAHRARQLFVADPFNHAVRVVHVDSAEVRTPARAPRAPPTGPGASPRSCCRAR